MLNPDNDQQFPVFNDYQIVFDIFPILMIIWTWLTFKDTMKIYGSIEIESGTKVPGMDLFLIVDVLFGP